MHRILETITEKHIDNVVMGSQASGVPRNLLTGSIADQVTRGVRCHIGTIRPPAPAGCTDGWRRKDRLLSMYSPRMVVAHSALGASNDFDRSLARAIPLLRWQIEVPIPVLAAFGVVIAGHELGWCWRR